MSTRKNNQTSPLSFSPFTPASQAPQEITLRKFLNLVLEITHAINQNDDPEQALDKILQACMDSTNADSGSIMLVDPDRKFLQMHVSRGLSHNIQNIKKLKLRMGEGVTGWVAKSGKARIVYNTHEEGDYVTLEPELLSELAVPMLLKDQVIGVFSLDAKRKNAFAKEEQEFLSIMANLATQIFMNLRDNKLLKLRDRFHRVMIETSRVISKPLPLRDVFQEVMKITEQAFRLYRSVLFLYNQKEGVLQVEAALELTQKEGQKISYAPGEGITGQVFINKKPVFIPSVLHAPSFLNRMKHSIESDDLGFFCAPIFSGNDVVGVFSTFMRPQNGIEPHSILEFLEILGSCFSQAITIQQLVQDETKIVRFENIQLKRELSSRYQFGSLIGRSPLMHQLFEKARTVSSSRASVLITGESGTGKELIASALHYNSPRRDGPFVKLNCAAIPTTLMESELFGHRKGSFTGAISNRKGKFEIANGGSIFLDEIGELHIELQSKLLRVLQEREIEPIGGHVQNIDIRIIAATNIDIEKRINEKRFRADLYYRLNVIHLGIPPLRQRWEDVLPLSHYFLQKYATENNKRIKGFTPKVIRALEAFPWPGNVRQLENSIERAVVLSQSEILNEYDFPEACSYVKTNLNSEKQKGIQKGIQKEIQIEDIEKNKNIQKPKTFSSLFSLEKELEKNTGDAYHKIIQSVETELIILTLKKFRYKKSQVARHLGIHRSTLYKKIQELNIQY